jgi:VWFA-related protein
MYKKLTFLGAAITSLALAQAPPAADTVLRSNTRLVLLDVLVNNDRGPVRGLAKEDFVLEDKGKKQSVVVFDVTESGKASAAAALPAGVASNRLNSKGETQGSATVILYDRINTGAGDQAFVRSQVLRALAGLKDSDHVGFYSLGSSLRMVSDYDEDSAQLVRVAKAMLQSNSAPASMSAEDKVMFKNLTDAISPMQQLQPQARVNITYPAFRSIARHMSGVPGRKNLVWVTSVFPLTFGNSVERRKNDEVEVEAFKNNLTEANISLYPVDPGGTGASFNQTDGAPVANEGSLMPGSLRNSAGTSSITNVSTSLTGNQTMQMLAEASGGKAFRNANDIAPALREVIAAADYTYTLGFYPDEKTLDNKNHELKVTLSKKPATDKAKTTHRKQYFAWGPKSPAELQPKPTMTEVLDDSLMAHSIGLMAVANPDPAKPGTQVIDLRISAADLRFDPKGDQFTSSFDVAIAIEGQKVVSMKTFAPNFPGDVLQKVRTDGLDIREVIDTSGASGVFRIGVIDKNTGATGSIRLPFTGTK